MSKKCCSKTTSLEDGLIVTPTGGWQPAIMNSLLSTHVDCPTHAYMLNSSPARHSATAVN